METSASVAPFESFTPGFRKVELGSGERTEQTGESALVENLVLIKSDSRALALLEHLQQTVAILERRIHRNRKQIRTTQDEILRLVVLYCALQVLLLLCVAYSNVLQCRNLWTPVALSALTSIITFRGVFQKYLTVESLQHILSSEEQTFKVVVKRLYELRQEGPKYLEACVGRRDSLERWPRPAVIDIFLVVPLVLFSMIILASFWHILCQS